MQNIVAAGVAAALVVGVIHGIFSAAAARAIRARLVALGHTPARIQRRWMRRLFVRGFSVFGVAFWVTMTGDEGRTRLFGYEPAGWLVRSGNGVKRYSGGVWRDEYAPRQTPAEAAQQKRQRVDRT